MHVTDVHEILALQLWNEQHDIYAENSAVIFLFLFVTQLNSTPFY